MTQSRSALKMSLIKEVSPNIIEIVWDHVKICPNHCYLVPIVPFYWSYFKVFNGKYNAW